MITRDLQLGLLEGSDKPIGAMPLSIQGGQNHDVIRTLAPLYLTGSVLDVTYGKGGWWRSWRPEHFAFHDLELDGVDFRRLPEEDRSWDTVCFDPPYVPRHGKDAAPTVRLEAYRERYGLEVSRSASAMARLHAAGMAEVARVARRWVLVKCTDYSNGRQLHLGHVSMIELGIRSGLKVHDLIVHQTRPGPGNNRIREIKRSRQAHSYLIVFRARSGRWSPG